MTKMTKDEKDAMVARLRSLDETALRNTLMGCSFELSLCDEIEGTPEDNFPSKEEIQEDMDLLIAEVKRRRNN